NPPPGKPGDPLVPDWAKMQLAETWADGIRFNTVSGLSTFLRSIFGAPRQVEINADQALFSSIPKYALQEFHSLPNGNYSNKIARGYITGFDISMLGLVQKMRREIATRVSHCHSVLDVGTCGGKLAAAIK